MLSDLKGVEKSQDPDSSYALGFGMNYKIMDLKVRTVLYAFNMLICCTA